MENNNTKALNPYHNVKLESSIDYKFLAAQVGEKLKNPNYKSEWRVAFLKALAEELKPLLSQAGLQRIEKTAQDLFYQKLDEEKAEQAQAKALAEANLKKTEKKEAKKNVRLTGRRNKLGYEQEDLPDSNDDDDDS